MKTFINPTHLWPYREFDRRRTPAPVCFGMLTYTIEQVIDYIKANGIEPIEVSIIDNKKILVTDGNHRLAAAIISGFLFIPITVKHYTQEEACEVFCSHTIARFK